MDDNIAIKVDNVSKDFKIPLDKSTSLKRSFINFVTRKNGYRKLEAVNNISFAIDKGEFFGIVGRNGSGKSTLLKMLAGIYVPNKGAITVSGSLIPFIELGVGFNPELSGRENIFLNGALLGFSKKEMNGMYDDIVDFAELAEFMEEKLKNYSSGMQVRLAFSIAIRAKGDMLILDEVLAVGDENFQKKCVNYFASIKKGNQTVVLVTHDMTNVEKFCDRVLVMDKGRSIGIMNPIKAKKTYEQINRKHEPLKKIIKLDKRWGSGEVKFDDVELLGIEKKGYIESERSFTIKLSFKTKSTKAVPVLIGLAIEDEFGVNMSGPNSKGNAIDSGDTVSYIVDKNPLSPGKYFVRLSILDNHGIQEYDHIENALSFEVVNDSDTDIHGKVNLFGRWEKK